MTVDSAWFVPTVAEVEALLAARGTFTADSTPTSAQVAQRAQNIADELAGELTTLPDSLYGLAKQTVIYKVGADLEAGAWPEQQFGAGASGGIWYARYVQDHDRLLALASDYGDTPGSAKSVLAPSGTALAWADMVANEGANWPAGYCYPSVF